MLRGHSGVTPENFTTLAHFSVSAISRSPNSAGVNRHRRAAELVPTIGETVPGYRVDVWNGIVAPRGTPWEIAGTLNRAVNAVLADRRLQALRRGAG